MSFAKKLKSELKNVAVTTLFFAIWFVAMMLFKSLVLADYQIHFGGVSVALVGALIAAKVVILTEHVSLGAWVRTQPRVIDVLLRTALHMIGVIIVLLLERAFESRHEYDGFVPALVNVFKHRDIYTVWASAIGVTGALLTFNAIAVLRQVLDQQGLSWSKVFFARPWSGSK